MHSKKPHGFVLITVLLFIQAFSLLSTINLSTISLHEKLNYFGLKNITFKRYCQKTLAYLESQIAEKPDACSISLTPATQLGKNPLSWWQTNTCHANVDGVNIYYVVEALLDNTCATVENSINNQAVTFQYYRLTLRALPKWKHGRYVLQSTIALPTTRTCKPSGRVIKIGQQSWREI